MPRWCLLRVLQEVEMPHPLLNISHLPLLFTVVPSTATWTIPLLTQTLCSSLLPRLILSSLRPPLPLPRSFPSPAILHLSLLRLSWLQLWAEREAWQVFAPWLPSQAAYRESMLHLLLKIALFLSRRQDWTLLRNPMPVTRNSSSVAVVGIGGPCGCRLRVSFMGLLVASVL